MDSKIEDGPKDQRSKSAKIRPSESSPIYRIFGLTFLTALSIELTRLCLSPVYGTSTKIPFSFGWEVNVVIFVYITNSELSYKFQSNLISVLPILGCAIPTILSQSFQLSSQLGPSWGPALTSLVTVLPLLYLSLLQVMRDNMSLAQQTPELLASLGPYPGVPLLVAAWGTFFGFRRVAALGLQFCINYSGTGIFGRFGMQVLLSSIFAGWAWKRKQYWVVSLTMIAIFNLHVPAAWNDGRLQRVLEREGYALVARQESLTGYISVLDNLREGFRVMRCDHSLLGGEWITREVGSKLREPVYAIFVMLEAVRLVKTKRTPPKSDADTKALIIGVGVGTSPAAFVAHGITTTSIEVDPVVHNYATEYFSLPVHKVIVGDAIFAVKDMRNGTYDYIIHDVFTGGVESLELFTCVFLQDLKRLLTDEGTIAINYAGNLLLPTVASVVATVLSVFPTCRMFRESEPVGTIEDFTNLVLFCKKSADDSLAFREPTTADFLASGARKEFLMPRLEVEPSSLGVNSETRVIDSKAIKALARSQEQSRLGHWRVMRSVLPDAVWENW